VALTLKLTPNPIEPGKNLRVEGAGFDPSKKVQLALDGNGWSSNYFRPASDGTFHIGMNVTTTPKTQVVSAHYYGSYNVIASASVVVAKVVVPPPPPTPVKPAAPTGLVVVSKSKAVSLTWGVVSLANSYKIYQDNGLIGTSTSPSFTVTGLTNGQSYSFKVSAVNAVGEGPFSTPISATPTAQNIVQFPGSGASTPAALLTLMSNTAYDVIEIAAGTYSQWACFVNVDRTSAHPLLIRPAANAAVIWDGTGLNDGSPPWRIGWNSLASYITWDPAGTGGSFKIQNYTIGMAGLVMTKYINHVTFNGVIVRDCNGGYGGAAPQHTHCVYLGTDTTTPPHRSQYWVSNSWDVIGPSNRYFNGFQTDHAPNTDHVIANSWTVSSLHRAVYAYADPTDLTIDGWTIADCDATIDNDGDTATGVVSNCHSTNSGPLTPGSGQWTANGLLVSGGGNTSS
jgi:hypothetical protein